MLLTTEIQPQETSSLATLLSPLIGSVVWLVGMAVVRPHPFDKSWALAILAFAPLVIVPMGLSLATQRSGNGNEDRLRKWVRFLQLPAALLLAAALTLSPGGLAALMAVPWLIVSLLIAAIGLGSLMRGGFHSSRDVGIAAGMIMLAVGAGWAVLDRWDVRPLGYEPVIVLLTAIHFHYAGFTLPILAGLCAPALSKPMSKWMVTAVVLSVPAVAIGITATQLKISPLLESVAAWLMSFAGILVSWSYWRLSHQTRWPKVARRLWLLAAVFLACGMVLACLYGSRHVVAMEWLDIPWMRALHGTANAFGFSLLAMLGWIAAEKTSILSPDGNRE